MNDTRTGLVLLNGGGEVALRYEGLFAVDANGVMLEAWLEVTGSTLEIYVDESNAQYPIVVDPLIQQAYLKASNTGPDDIFGFSVAASGDTVVVGAPFEDSAATGVNGDEADNSAQNSGAAYVFVRSAGIWTQEAYLKASNAESLDQFGLSVAMSGDTLVVGGHLEDSGATGVNGDETGNSAEAAGAAYVFVRSGNTWSQEAYLKASNTAADDQFGAWVAMSGDTVVVGARNEDSGATGVNGDETDDSVQESGAAYVFVRSGNTWSQEAYLKASNTEAFDAFGGRFAVSEDTVIVGAKGEDSGATGVNGDEGSNSAFESGAAYVFVRSGSTWTQEAYLKASNAEAFEFFGFALAASGDTVVVSAPSEDSAATGVNGNEADNSAFLSGAAYVFVRSSGTWRQAAYLKASNTDREDLFGRGVAVSGDTVIVTAQGEASGATGVNGDESDNAVEGSGAAYVFSAGLVVPGVGDHVCFGTVNSTGFAGTLTALGSPAASDNSLALEAACCPPESFGLVITSSSNGGPIQSIAAGEGILCIDNPQVGRFFPILTSASGAALQAVDLSAIPTNVGTAAALPGDTYYFQFWHRDSLGGVATSNLTNAISVLFQ